MSMIYMTYIYIYICHIYHIYDICLSYVMIDHSHVLCISEGVFYLKGTDTVWVQICVSNSEGDRHFEFANTPNNLGRPDSP